MEDRKNPFIFCFCKLCQQSVQSFKMCLNSLSRAVFHHREHIVSKIFPWIPISVTGWLYVGLMLASIHVKVLGCLFINRLYSGNEARSPVGNGCLLGASVHLLLNAPTLPSVRTLLILSPLQPSDWGDALATTGLLVPFPVLHMMSETHGCRT